MIDGRIILHNLLFYKFKLTLKNRLKLSSPMICSSSHTVLLTAIVSLGGQGQLTLTFYLNAYIIVSP